MIFEDISITSAVVASTTGIFVSVWLYQRWQALEYLQKHGIICPINPSLILGNLHQLRYSTEENILEKQTSWIMQYGKVFGYYMGIKPRIVIADLDIVREILVKHIHIFTNRPDVPRNMPTLVSLRDQRWKEIRHVLTPVFSTAKLKGMFSTIRDCVALFTEIVEKLPENTEVDIHEHFQALTLDVISRCALALNLNCQENSEDKILLAVRKFFKLDLSRIVVLLLCFPGLRIVFRQLFRFAPSNKLITFVLQHVKAVIEERRKSGKMFAGHADVIQLLLEASEDVEQEQNFKSASKQPALLSDEEMAWNACVFLLAGYETTSTALSYITYCISQHPDVQQEIVREIQEVVGPNDQPLTYENVNQLHYLEQVINESLRLYPPVPLFVSRECKETLQIKGVTIPRDSSVDVPVWFIHRDPEIWLEPEKFDPSRHAPREKAKRHPLSFLPFGAGPRNCIGARFAMIEMKIAVAELVRRHVIRPSERNINKLDTVVRTTIMNPANGVWVKLESRQ